MDDDGNKKNSSFICCLNNHKRNACGSGGIYKLMKKIAVILSILQLINCAFSQTDTIIEVPFDLKKTNPNSFYQYELDSGNFCLIKYDKKQRIKEIVFINHDGASKVDTFKNKYLKRYSSVDKTNNKNGGEISIDKHGSIFIHGILDNKENGKTYFYVGKDKKIASIYEMKNGEAYGLDQDFDDFGNVHFEYFNNKRLPPGFEWRKIYYEGTQKLAQLSTCNEKYCVNEVYYENGKLDFIDTTYYNGGRIGYFKKYYDNGNLQEEGFYENYIKQGYWKYYYKNGQLHSEGTYDKGKEHGNIKYYQENKNLEKEIEFLMGEKNGVSKYYNSNGDLILIEKYKEGKRISKEKIR